MGFMNFMKKGTDTELDNSLDIPPPPPPIENSDSNQPFFQADKAKAAFDEKMPPPPMPKAPHQDSPVSDQAQKHVFDIPPISSSDKLQIRPEQSPGQMGIPNDASSVFPGKKEQKPSMQFDEFLGSKSIPEEKQQKHLFGYKTKETKTLHAIPEKQIFIEVTKYRRILKELNNMKKSLKQNDDEVSVLVGDLADEERTFSKLHSNLSEIEKKLVELESSIFTQ
ncbi:MAG: hypothetical protein KAK00_02810 [Nanoarchaeota archaeon]|nr:hypothetical protein [Nanoarchaeota archaeon]